MEGKLDGLAKGWRDNVRDLSYDMEDCIDRFMDRLGSGDAKSGFMKRTARRLRTLWERHDIATLIKDLKARVMEESERRERYKLDESYYTATRTVKIDPRITTLHEEVKGLVAMDNPLKHVTALLMDGEMELKVVPIVGSGGLGKTTLAMEVYRKIGLGGDFQCRASVSVSRTLDLEKLLKDILSQINDKEWHSDGLNIHQLISKTSKTLTGKRYFIVIDDVWKEQDWKLVKAAFPDNNNGSRIIATTRIARVADLCCSNSGGKPYQMEPLGDVDSQRLFFKRVFHSNDPCPADLEEVSTRILKKCGGLPLAITTFASLLANKTRNKDEWGELEESIGVGSSVADDGNLKTMKDILLLSYWDLPHQLKSCLLYLCIYPEDCTINCEELKWKWMAEGFIATQWGSLNQVVDNYFNELVNRNLIQAVHVDYDGSVEYCRVHDMVLDLIIYLSDEENFATILNGRICNSFPSKIRRLSIQSSIRQHKEAVLAITKNKLHVRSLTMFRQVQLLPSLVGFHALRVLDLIGCDWLEDKHIKNIGSSHQLRYLRICSMRVGKLPEEIGKLQHLEILDLRGTLSVTLPSTIVRLQKLVRLFVSRKTRFPDCDFGNMKALETLEVIHIWRNAKGMKFAEELGRLSNLRRLNINPDTHEVDAVTERLALSISELGKCNLRYLDIGGEICQHLFSDPSCSYPYLQDLKIVSWTHIEMVPMGMASLKNLAKLSMTVMEFGKQGLHLLMAMPSLVHLQLKIEMPTKEKLTVDSNGFKLLKVFHLTYTAAHQCEVEPADGLWLTFVPGAAPALRRFRLELNPMVVASHFFADLGVKHCSGLAHLEVKINCFRAVPELVEAMESSIENDIGMHPNCEIHISRVREDDMLNDEEEWGFLPTIMEEDEASEWDTDHEK